MIRSARPHLALAVFGAVLLFWVNAAEARPFRVCAFVFNNPDELSIIRANLPAPDFELIDLTPEHGFDTQGAAGLTPIAFDGAAATRAEGSGWFMRSCRADLQCDIVVYSGEFAGGFFGKYGISLNVQEIEEASCQARCAGLFHHPREVFLLGCNTLATKSADDRTPYQYLQVLLDHGFSRAAAERVVDLRYGPLGPSFREALRRSFMDVPRIYGFSSVAPRAEITAPLLQNYFLRKGDYAAYLSTAGRDSKPNRELLVSFAHTSLVQLTGLTAGEPAAADRTLVCRIYDETQTVTARLGVVRNLFSRQNFLSFVPTIEVFLNRHPPGTFAGEDRRLFADIQAQQAARQQVLDLVASLNVSVLKMQLAHLALQLGWISQEAFHRLAVDGVKQLLAEPLTTEVVEIACELSKYAPAGRQLRAEEIPEEILWHSEGFRLLDCLSPADPRLSTRMLAGLDRIEEPSRLWAAYALSRRLPLADAVLIELTRHLNDPSPGVCDRVKWIYEMQAPLSADVRAAVQARDPGLAKLLETRM